MVKTATQKTYEAIIKNGEELTAKQIAARFSIANPHNVIYNLRNEGNVIDLVERTDSKGRKTLKYTRGTPSQELIAAGYRFLRLNNRP